MKQFKQLQSIKKFYFLDYFYIVLASVEKHGQSSDVFEMFKILKQKHALGESKYKKLTADAEILTSNQQQRFYYTFKQAVAESKDYELIREDEENKLTLTEKGRKLLDQYENAGAQVFNRSIFTLMEEQYQGFRFFVEFLYRANPHRAGVLIFPHYSPLQLDIDRKNIQTTADIFHYADTLRKKLEEDIQLHLKQKVSLQCQNGEILDKLIKDKDNILPANPKNSFLAKDYNKITKRIRDFWITYFLRDMYKCQYAMATFDLWIYRAKQIGIIHATEAYPFLNGKLVYPTSVVVKSTNSADFTEIHQYQDRQRLYLHTPKQDGFQEEFVEAVVQGYFSLRKTSRNYFVNLSSLCEIVSYNLKISSHVFEQYLNIIYRLNLTGNLRIRISLEVDKLPEETNMMYLKREPVKVDGSYRNIIAIDVTKRRAEQ